MYNYKAAFAQICHYFFQEIDAVNTVYMFCGEATNNFYILSLDLKRDLNNNLPYSRKAC